MIMYLYYIHKTWQDIIFIKFVYNIYTPVTMQIISNRLTNIFSFVETCE